MIAAEYTRQAYSRKFLYTSNELTKAETVLFIDWELKPPYLHLTVMVKV